MAIGPSPIHLVDSILRVCDSQLLVPNPGGEKDDFFFFSFCYDTTPIADFTPWCIA